MSSINRKIFESLCNIINSLDNPSIVAQLNTFCNCITQRLYKESFYDELPDILPQIENDEIFLEWIFKDFRFGFLFCSDPSESGWIVVMDTPDGVRSSDRKFNGDIPKAATKIVDYITRLA